MSDLIDRLARRAAQRTGEQTTTPPRSRDRELDDVARWLTHTPLSRRKMLQVTGASVVGITVLHSVPARAATPSSRSRVRPMRVSGQTPDDGDCTYCNPAYDPCCITEQPNVCTDNALCCPPGTKACLGNPPSGVCCDPADPCYVDPDDGQPGCCAPAQQCSTICCAAGDVCVDNTAGTCCASGQACGTTCCPDGQTCLDPSSGVCCDPKQISGTTCCPSGQFPCDEQNGTCCPTSGGSCCPVGAPGSSSYVCCEAGRECVNQILPGDIGITAGSPKVCCPPAQLVTATTHHICCPPGSVVQPGGGVSVFGGLCCKAANVCGKHCCESGLPSYSLVCIKGGCHWKDVIIAQQKAAANADGNVPVPLSFSAGVQGTVSLQSAATGANATAAVAKPAVLGTAHFKVKHAGHQTIDVKLDRSARQRLTKARKLDVEAVITFTQHGKSASVSTPFTIKAPPRRRQRRGSH